MKHVLIVGKSFSGTKNYLAEHGLTYTILQDRLATKFPDKKFKNRVVADFSTVDSLLTAVDNLKEKPDAVITTYENYVLPAAHISTHLQLHGLPVSSAEACTDKSLMRSLFAKAPEKISPDFMTINSEEELLSFAHAHKFPLVIKPANLAKSLLVTKSNNEQELRANYQRAIEHLTSTYARYAPGRQPKLLVEEFLSGSIHSVDAFVDSSGEPHILDNVVDYQTGYDIGYEDNFHYSRILPSKLPSDQQASLRKCASIGIRALGMKSSPAHVEIIMTADGPRIVEIGARNGGYRERMHGVANGIDITANAINLILDKPLDIKARRNDSMAVLELFPKTPGIFSHIKNEDMLRTLSSLEYLSIKAKVGNYVGKAGDGYKMCAIVALHNADPLQFQNDLDFVNDNVSVVTNS